MVTSAENDEIAVQAERQVRLVFRHAGCNGK